MTKTSRGAPKGSRNAAKPPESVKSSRVVVRLTPSQKERLRDLARSDGVSESELIISRLPEIGGL